MGECARCGAFTDNPAEKEYQYCDDCHQLFDEIRQEGIIVQQARPGGYEVYVTKNSDKYEGGTEKRQADGLARAKYLEDELNAKALFEYQRSGSQWILNEYLQAHPDIRRNVMSRLNRVPERTEQGVLSRLRDLF